MTIFGLTQSRADSYRLYYTVVDLQVPLIDGLPGFYRNRTVHGKRHEKYDAFAVTHQLGQLRFRFPTYLIQALQVFPFSEGRIFIEFSGFTTCHVEFKRSSPLQKIVSNVEEVGSVSQNIFVHFIFDVAGKGYEVSIQSPVGNGPEPYGLERTVP